MGLFERIDGVKINTTNNYQFSIKKNSENIENITIPTIMPAIGYGIQNNFLNLYNKILFGEYLNGDVESNDHNQNNPHALSGAYLGIIKPIDIYKSNTKYTALYRSLCVNNYNYSTQTLISELSVATKNLDFDKISVYLQKGNIDEINKIITRSVLLEVSWVNLPCNQDALVQYMSTKQLSDDFKKFLGFKEIVKDESGTIQGSDLPKEIATDNTTNGETVKSPEVAITPVQEPEPIKETGIGRITEPPKTEIQIIDNQPIIENNPSEIIPQGQVEVEQVAVCSDTSVLTEVPRYFNIVYEPVKSIVDVEIKKIKGRVS
jgi:hypothetical protein